MWNECATLCFCVCLFLWMHQNKCVFSCACVCKKNKIKKKKELPGWSENQSREVCWCTPTNLFSTPGLGSKRQSGPLWAECVSVQPECDLPGGLTYTFSFRQARPTWFGWGDAAKRRRRWVYRWFEEICLCLKAVSHCHYWHFAHLPLVKLRSSSIHTWYT